MAETDDTDLLDVLGSIAEHLLLDDRWRLLSARDRLRQLERENAALRSAQRIAHEAPRAQANVDAWSVPDDPEAEELARLRAENARLREDNARMREALSRRPAETTSEIAKGETPAIDTREGEPVTRGSYR